jgi:tricorn protease
VYVKQLDGGEEHKVEAEDFLLSSGARWTPDGKKLLLLGGVGAPSMSSLNRTATQLYSVALTHIEKNPDDRDIDTEEQAQAAQATSGRSRSTTNSETAAPESERPRNGGDRAAKVVVKIEWDGLERRIKQISRMGGSVMNVVPSPDSKTYAFVAVGEVAGGDEESGRGGGRPALYTVGEDGTRLTVVAQGSPPEPSEESPRERERSFGGWFGEPQWARDGRTLYYLQGGAMYAVAAPGASNESALGSSMSSGRGMRSTSSSSMGAGGATPRRVSFTARLEIDQAAERRQVFEEAWRVMKNRFYDPKMHGVNWVTAKETYAALLPYVADSDELHTVIMEMIGELNASHTGVTGGGSRGSERVSTRYPGFDLESDASGYYRVSHIYKKGPADHDYVRLANGNYILAVNGKALKTGDNYWKLFNLVSGRKFEFTVNSKPGKEGAWTISLEPLGSTSQGNLEYERWVESRKSMVQKLSNGQVGYLHIRAMNGPSFQKFQRDLLDNLGKKALVIDERFNGGGGIDQELLEILNQRVKYQSWRGRDSVEIPRPVQAFFGPMVVLQNERSASNAEMFPEGFRALGLGKVIGVPTMGAVIGTGSYRLMDGSTIRTPGIGVFTARGESLENYGVQPDVLVDNSPEDFLGGRDRQIEKAVEVLQAQMK